MTIKKLAIVDVPIKKLKLDKGNPRKISDESMAKLQRSLKEFGFVDPVIVRKKDNRVIGGHQRILAAKANGDKQVPVIYINISDEKLKLLNVALNNPSIQGEWDKEKLTEYLSDIDMDITLTGFDEDEIKRLLAPVNIEDQADLIIESWQVVCDCDNETEQRKLYEKLMGENIKCQLRIL